MSKFAKGGPFAILNFRHLQRGDPLRFSVFVFSKIAKGGPFAICDFKFLEFARGRLFALFNFQDLQGCYAWYCNDPFVADEVCCGKVDSGGSSEGETTTEAAVTQITYKLKDARQITFDTLSYWKDVFNRPIDLEIKGQDEFRFEHYGWCWEDDPDLDKDFVKGTPRSAHSAYNNPNCEREQKYAGKPPPETPEGPYEFGFRWPCSFSDPPVKGIPNHFPNLEQRFTPAELIFDGRKDKYQKFKFSNEYNRYKFFRIHNLNNYDMEFEFDSIVTF